MLMHSRSVHREKEITPSPVLWSSRDGEDVDDPRYRAQDLRKELQTNDSRIERKR